MSYDTLRVVMMCLRHSLKLQGNHIITLAKQAYNIWRSQIHNSKLITSRSHFAKRVISYDCLRQVMSCDTLRVVMMCLRHSLKEQGNHIITLAKQAYNIWRSQIHNSKLITSRSHFAKRVISYDCLRQVMSCDTLRVVMMCLRHSLKEQGNHIITLAKQAYNIWQSQIHNSKLVGYDTLRQVTTRKNK